MNIAKMTSLAAPPSEIEEFLGGPLITWLATCVRKPDTLSVYECLFDGGLINEVLLQIDPEPLQAVTSPLTPTNGGANSVLLRIKTFECIVKTIKSFYEDELGQIVVAIPDYVCLAREPGSRAGLDNMRLLLLLLLGCAVQCPTKERFITKIKELPLDSQHDIVECIKQVTDEQTVILTLEWSEHPPERLYSHVRALIRERDHYLQHWGTALSQDNPRGSPGQTTPIGVESNHLAVELADWKSRLRKQRQELEEKSEGLAECREELEHANVLLAKLRAENNELLAEARRAKAYRDEADAMREKAERVDRLELETQRYRERLADSDFYRVRVDELREDNRVLLETREMLESQLARARQRAEHVLELEAELLGCKQNINDITLDRDAAKEKIRELSDENIHLQMLTKSALQETSMVSIESDSDREADETNSGDNSLSEQLSNNAQARALKLELENRKLLSTIDNLRESSFHENSSKILDLEKEKKKTMLKCEQLQENCDRLTQQNLELENIFKNALMENRKLQETLDNNKVLADRQSQELQAEKNKITELENIIEALTKEKQRIQSLCDSVQKRADDSEKSLNQVKEQSRQLQVQADRCKELEKLGTEQRDKIASLEKETSSVQKEVIKLKELLESKDVSLDEHSALTDKQEKELARLAKENENITVQLEKLQEFEQKATELLSQTAVYTETITTLQNDLVSEKLTNEKFKTVIEKLGLGMDALDNDINIIIEKICTNPDIVKNVTSYLKDKLQNESTCEICNSEPKSQEMGDLLSQTEQVVSSVSAEWNQQCEKLCSELTAMQQLNESLQGENARMQVDISTLTSQVNSLSTQQMALQLANSQLVAEKEELSKQQEIQQTNHDQLLLDQETLRLLHEQLNAEYEAMRKEQESLKKTNRDLRSELRTLKETNITQEKKIESIEQDKENLKAESKNLGNLRAEHSKLKDDFRNLFTASERLKAEYRSLQEEYRGVRAESGRLRLGHTEMQGQLSTRSDLLAALQLENTKLQQRCDMLFEMNTSLDTDRRALMDHVSQLLSQYHSLLTHSLEDKQHYHMEEKMFTDKVNNLHRQKEKLEEKIMEHYRKLDSCTPKKKSFGATLVRRVRKASSDFINKVPSRNRRSWHEDSRLSQSQFTLGGGSGESANNDSDNSLEEPARSEAVKRAETGSLHSIKPRDEIALRRSHRDLNQHRGSLPGDTLYSRDSGSALSLGSVGTRRTVYLAEEEPQPPVTKPSTPQQTPLLVYNRISTVIGETQIVPQPTEEPTHDAQPERKVREGRKENEICGYRLFAYRAKSHLFKSRRLSDPSGRGIQYES